MKITKKNHYNPCFWTAYWNPQYYNSVLSNTNCSLDPRKQKIYSLNIRANNILDTTIENVHYEKHLGIAKITSDSAKKYCRKYYPEGYNELSKLFEENPNSLFLDIENIFTSLEQNEAYKILLSVIKKNKIENSDEKIFLSSFIILHNLRNHALMKSMVEISEKVGNEKFVDRKSTRLNSSHTDISRMPSSA